MNLRKILGSLLTIGLVTGVAFGASQAFFSDTETSTDNTFVAGQVDLLIDSTSHYNGMVCALNRNDEYVWTDEENKSTDPETFESSTYPELLGTECTGTWTAQDLEANPFFNFTDLKPGDYGENTLSIRVEDNDSHMWARIVGRENAENILIEPEEDLDSTPVDNDEDDTDLWCGELAQNMRYTLWIDDGGNGFGDADVNEGNNILDNGEVVLVNNELVLTAEDAEAACLGEPTELATDWQYLSVIPGSQTWYYGLSWVLPTETGNEVQTDGIVFDMEFYAEQARNNPSPVPPTP